MFAKLIVGIERPTEGRIFLDGSDITDLGIVQVVFRAYK